MNVYVFYAPRGNSPPGEGWQIQLGPAYVEFQLICFQPSAGYVFLDNNSTIGGAGNASNHNPSPPTISPIDPHTLAVCFGANWGGSGAGGWIAPVNFTVDSDNTVGNKGCIASAVLLNSNPITPGPFGGVAAGTFDYWDGVTITIDDLFDRNVTPAQEPQLVFYDSY